MWVASWCGVIKYHGPKPVPAPERVWVANHSSMIDYTLLTAYMPFACIMQLQPGWVEFLQRRILTCLGCLLFNRTEVLQGFTPGPDMHCGHADVRCFVEAALGGSLVRCASQCKPLQLLAQIDIVMHKVPTIVH
jgi:hypothetical protein